MDSLASAGHTSTLAVSGLAKPAMDSGIPQVALGGALGAFVAMSPLELAVKMGKVTRGTSTDSALAHATIIGGAVAGGLIAAQFTNHADTYETIAKEAGIAAAVGGVFATPGLLLARNPSSQVATAVNRSGEAGPALAIAAFMGLAAATATAMIRNSDS